MGCSGGGNEAVACGCLLLGGCMKVLDIETAMMATGIWLRIWTCVGMVMVKG